MRTGTFSWLRLELLMQSRLNKQQKEILEEDRNFPHTIRTEYKLFGADGNRIFRIRLKSLKNKGLVTIS